MVNVLIEVLFSKQKKEKRTNVLMEDYKCMEHVSTEGALLHVGRLGVRFQETCVVCVI